MLEESVYAENEYFQRLNKNIALAAFFGTLGSSSKEGLSALKDFLTEEKTVAKEREINLDQLASVGIKVISNG